MEKKSIGFIIGGVVIGKPTYNLKITSKHIVILYSLYLHIETKYGNQFYDVAVVNRPLPITEN